MGTTFSTTPTAGRGKDEIATAVSTFSPGLMRSFLENADDFKLAEALPVRMRGCGLVSRMTPAPLVWSLMRRTWAVAGKDVATLQRCRRGDDGHVRLQVVVGALSR